MKKLLFILIAINLLFVACDDENSGTGSIQMYVEPEWTITQGIEAGEGPEKMHDGWSLSYERFVISLGDIYVTKSSENAKEFRMDNNYVIDLKNAPSSGLVVAEFSNVPSGDWDRVGYSMLAANSDSQKLGGISDDLFNEMVDHQLAVSARMVLSNPSGQVCPYDLEGDNPIDPQRPCIDRNEVILDWELPFPAKAEGCMTPSQVGLTVPSGGTAQIKLTIHADHHFFTAMRHTDIQRLAQPVIDADLNEDGFITLEELQQVPVAVLDPAVYDLSTFPQLETLYDYVRWTTITFPHYQGDGGCPERTPLDGGENLEENKHQH
ncbi:MAG: hypothetical protein PF689_07095 [Deltaproteobacteria bacterium]|nr:hypothetical protein [Deltaproteobacteria bacterium]